MKFVLIAAAAGMVAGCAFISPNATDLPEARFDLSEPFEYTRHDHPPEDAASVVETARWDQAVPASLVIILLAREMTITGLRAVASIEVDPPAMVLLNSRWPAVVDALLALGFGRVDLDPEGYRRGSLLAASRAN